MDGWANEDHTEKQLYRSTLHCGQKHETQKEHVKGRRRGCGWF